MNEQEWLTSDDPFRMLGCLTNGFDGCMGVRRDRQTPFPLNASDRKLRLFADACCLIAYGDKANLEAIADLDGQARAERWAEEKEFREPSKGTRAALLREIFGNPFQRQGVCKSCDGSGAYSFPEAASVDMSDGWYKCDRCNGTGTYFPWLTWNNGLIPKMAGDIYERKAFDEMPILADALEEAGCTEKSILEHCHGLELCSDCSCPPWNPYTAADMNCEKCKETGWMPIRSPHVRGCWVLDLLLDKE